MNAGFLTAPLAQAIGWALLHLIWQGTIVAAILAAALAILQQKSANVRYAVACAALALLPALAIATAWRCYEPLSIPASSPLFFTPESMPGDVAKAVVTHAARNAVLSAGDIARSALPYVVLTWLLGVTILSLRLFVGLSRVQQLARRAVPASLEWESTLRRISHALGLRYAVALLQTAAAEVPTVVGWLRPVILLPASTLSGLSAEQIEMLLAHELAHIRRNDFFVNILQSVVETLLFYHPAAWWISSRIRMERENSCDDLAVAVCGNAVGYARALTRLEELRSARSGFAVAANGGSLVSRIRRLVGTPADTTASVSRWFAAIGLLAIVAIVLSVPTLPARADREPQKPAAPKAVPAPKATPAPHPAAAAIPPHATVIVKADPDEISDAVADALDSIDIDLDAMPDVPVPPVPPAIAVAPPAIHIAAPHVAIAPLPPAAPMAIAVADVAPVIAAAIADGVEGGVAGGVRGGVRGGVHGGVAGGVHRHERRTFGTSGKLTVDEIIELRAAGVTPEAIADLRGSGLGDLTLDEIAGLSSLGVRSQYIRDLRGAGIEISNAREAMTLHAVGITPAWVRQMSEAGYPNLSRQDLIELRAMGVNGEFVKALADAGWPNLSPRELIRLKATGVTPDYMREMSKYRDRK